ncbi:MAG: PAS domain-containing protein, partial [Pseudomonadales bacterium]|nr:PAS domain-containing protein [Pseudomonadales bacterium]
MSAQTHAARTQSAISEELAGLSEPAIALDRDHRILGANDAYLEVVASGYPVLGRHCYEISHGLDRPCDQAGESCPLKASIATGHKERMLHIHLSNSGRELVDVTITPVRVEDGVPGFYIESLMPTI